MLDIEESWIYIGKRDRQKFQNVLRRERGSWTSDAHVGCAAELV